MSFWCEISVVKSKINWIFSHIGYIIDICLKKMHCNIKLRINIKVNKDV